MEESNYQSPELQNKGQLVKTSVVSKKLIFSFIVVVIVLIIIFIGVDRYKLPVKKSNTANQYNSQPVMLSPTASQAPSISADKNDFFFFSIPKPFQNLTIFQLPNTGNPRNVVQYKNSLWFTTGGNLIEYDMKNSKLLSYSNMTKANCDSNVVIVNNFLYTSCHTDNIEDAFGKTYQLTSRIYTGHYSIYKINPSTHQVEYIFTDKDGLQNRYNYKLFVDGNDIWIATFNGLGRINTKTNHVDFYTKELGFQEVSNAVSYNIWPIVIDKDYVWVWNIASVDSQGGIALYNKELRTWKAFGPRELMDYSPYRIDLESNAIKLIPGGIQIGFRDGNIGDNNRFVEKQYIYETGQWTKVAGSDKPITGEYYEQTSKYIDSTYPSSPKYLSIDQFGLTQLQLPETNQNFQLDGRDNYILSPMIGNKRYILTSSTVDVIDDSSSFRQILVKLGSLPSSGISYGSDPSMYEGLLNFLIDSNSLLAIVTDSACGGMGCSGQEKVWLIDLKAGKLLRIYTKADGIKAEQLSNLSMMREGNLLIIKDKTGKQVFNIETTNYKLTVL